MVMGSDSSVHKKSVVTPRTQSPLSFLAREANVHMWITSKHNGVFCVALCEDTFLASPAAALSYQTTCKNVTHMACLFKRAWLSCMEIIAHPQNTNKESHMWGDELGKLHNIFIRYNFTCLVDGLQRETLKINSARQKGKDLRLTEGKSMKHGATKPNEQ